MPPEVQVQRNRSAQGTEIERGGLWNTRSFDTEVLSRTGAPSAFARRRAQSLFQELERRGL